VTSVLGIVLGLALPSMVGYQVARLTLGFPSASFPARVQAAAVGVLLGIGASSLTTFGWLLLGGSISRAFAVADTAFWGGAVGTVLALRRRRGGWLPADGRRSAAGKPEVKDVAMMALLVAALSVAIVAFAVVTERAPHGHWDAWVIWSQRARFIVRSGSNWRDAFGSALAWARTDYPLLLPLSIARLWGLAGETALAPQILAATFTFVPVFVVVGSLWVPCGRTAAVLAGLLLVGTPGYVAQGAMQYADLAVGGYLVAAASFLPRPWGSAERARLGLVGFLLGCAGWTKNDGIPAAGIVALLAVHLGSVAARRRPGGAAGWLALGALAPAAAWAALGSLLPGSRFASYQVAQTTAPLWERLTDLHRWAAALAAAGSAIPGMHVGMPLIVLAVAIAFGAAGARAVRSPLIGAALASYAVLVVVFVASPYVFDWHVASAADRLAMQPWPLAILAVFTSATMSRPAGPGVVAGSGRTCLGGA
jgi:hypothetical protein